MKYKIFSFVAAPVFLGVLSLSLAVNAYGQEDPPPPKPTPKPVPRVIATPTPMPQIQIPENPRERRALAYAKLMEGQRFIKMLQGNPSQGSFMNIINSARNALQQAITLEPKLAEAYTALAELTVQAPPQDLEEAIRLANKAIEASKDNFGAHRLLSRIYTVRSGVAQRQLNKKYVELAINELKEVVRLDENDAEGWALLSEFYQATGKRDEAITALKNWSDAPMPLDAQEGFYRSLTGSILTTDVAAARLGEAYLQSGKHSDAIAALSRAIYLNPDEEGYIELLVEVFDESGDSSSGTITEIKRLVATNPANVKLAKLLAQTLSRAGKTEEAIKTIQDALSKFEDDGDSNEAFSLQLLLGETYTNVFREREAIAAYEEILKKNQLETKARLDEEERQTVELVFPRIVSLQKNLDNFKEAEVTISRMRKVLGAEDSSADEESIELLRDQGKRTEALQAIRLLRQRFPQHLNLAIQEAQILTDLNQVDEGVAILRAKTSTSPATEIQLNLIISSLYSQAKRGKDAVDSAQKAMALIPQSGQRLLHNALATLASAQDAAGDFKGAENSLRRILSDKPNDATALNNLGYFMVERNERLEEALAMIQKAHRSEPTNSSFLDSLGWAYFRLGKFTEAERYLSEAARRNPFSATIQDHLGDVYQKLGKVDPARAAWQQALKLETDRETQAKIKAKLNNKTLSVK